MGTYILKIAAAPIIIDGVKLHRATFAYKPWGRSELDDSIRGRLKLPALEKKWADKPHPEQTNILVEYGGEIYPLDRCHGTISDCYLTDRPSWGMVAKRGRGRGIRWDLLRVWQITQGYKVWRVEADRATGLVTLKYPDGEACDFWTVAATPEEYALNSFLQTKTAQVRAFMAGQNVFSEL